MKLLLAYLRAHRWMVILAIALAAVNQVFSLLDPHPAPWAAAEEPATAVPDP